MSLNIVSQKASRALFYPIPMMIHHTNKRATRCAACGAHIPAGHGHKWDFSEEAYAVTAKLASRFYCDSCHNHRLALLELQPDVEAALAEIQKWCQCVPLSMHQITYEAISRMVHRCDLAQADVARGIARALDELEECSYGAALSTARKVTQEVMAVYGGEA